MCEILDKYINQGIELGINKGENLMGSLIECLLRDKRDKDIAIAVSDKEARRALYREYKIKA